MRKIALACWAVVVAAACSAGTTEQTGNDTGRSTPHGNVGGGAGTAAGGGSAGSGSGGSAGNGGPSNTGGAAQGPGGAGAGSATAGAGGASAAGAGGTAPAGGAGGGTAGTQNMGTAGTGNAPDQPPTPDPPGTVSMVVDTFTIPAGDEVIKCQNFDNPFGGVDTPINRVVSDMTPGSHHLHLYNLTEGTSRTVADCPNSDFHALIHAAGRPHVETDYPAGMATKVKGSTGMRVQLHYLNTTSDAATVNATVKLSPVAASGITNWVAELYFNRVQLSVPPGDGQIVSTTCAIPPTFGSISLLWGASHMHKRGIQFVVTANNTLPLGTATTWDEPAPFTYDPAVVLKPGDTINWTCTYNNDTGSTLVFGESAQTNEMCIFLARYYTTNSNDSQIECQAPTANGGTAYVDSN